MSSCQLPASQDLNYGSNNKWLQSLALDLRALAVGRIFLSLILLWESLYRICDLTAFQTDLGFLPRAALLEKFLSTWNISFHLAGGSYAFQLFLNLTQALFALFFLFGFKTRLVNFICWIFLVSLQTRNGIILQAGDVFFRLLLFWSLFLPMGAKYSIDSALNKNKENLPSSVSSNKSTTVSSNESTTILSFGSVGFIFQVLIVYIFTAALKTDPIWWPKGEAIYYALSLDQFAKPLGHFILQFPNLMRLMTLSTFALELIGPILFLIPHWIFRTVIVLSFIGFHLGLHLTMYLGSFPFICIAAWVTLFPTAFIDKIGVFLSRKNKSPLKVYYDADCGFCEKSVWILKEFLLLKNISIEMAQSDPKAFEILQQKNSWVVINAEGHVFTEFAGFREMLKNSLLFSAFSLLLKPFQSVGDFFYRLVAQNRFVFSRLTSSLQPVKPMRISKLNQFLAAFFVLYILLWNLRGMDFSRWKKIFPPSLNPLAQVLRLDQKWDMFAPFPLKDDGWYVIEGKLKNGELVNVLRPDEPVSFLKPEDVANTYKNSRWRKYMMNLRREKNKDYRLYFGKYLCRSWNNDHKGESQLYEFNMFYMLEKTLPGYKKFEPKRETLWHHYCFGNPTVENKTEKTPIPGGLKGAAEPTKTLPLK